MNKPIAVVVVCAVAAAWLSYLWFVSGVLPRQDHYPSGALRATGHVKRIGWGEYKRHGFWRYQHEDGRPLAEGSFEFGRPVGKWKCWSDDAHPAIRDAVEVEQFLR